MIKKGLFTRKRNPTPIKIYSLKEALCKVNTHKLAKELAYVLSTTMSYRLMYEDRYNLAYNVIPLKSSDDWNNILVLQVEKELVKFSNIVCINIEDYTQDFKIKNPVFIKLVLSELNKIRRS